MVSDMSTNKCIIVDLDGTFFNNDDWVRDNYPPNDTAEEWDKFTKGYRNEEAVDENIRDIVVGRFLCGEYIFFVTGREDTHNSREKTNNAIREHINHPFKLLMRKSGDLRQNHEVKKDWLDYIRSKNFHVVLAIDDDIGNVRMFAENGVQCLVNVKPNGWHLKDLD